MKSIKDERIFLIIAGKFIIYSFESIRGCSTVDSIYICCVHYEKYKHLQNRPKMTDYLT
jgi:hypothetical protein